MASYGLEARFKGPRYCFRLTDPSAYNHSSTLSGCKLTKNKYGFLSNTPRNTQLWSASYTDKIYNARVEHKIPNVTSLKSTTPRFSFKPFTEDELDEILCTCDIEDPCVCATPPEVCQAYEHKRIFKGAPPHSVLGDGISVPTKRDHGFEILCDGSTRRLLDTVGEDCPPFYDTRVHCSSDFYRGCKWSQWRTPRMGAKSLEKRPGPADYMLEREKTPYDVCLEKVRAKNRKNSKQLRFIESVIEKNIRESRPGPADYNPQMPKCTDLKFLGAKQVRFSSSNFNKSPGPTTYSLKRDFDRPEPLINPCIAIAKLPAPAGFGAKAPRFISREHLGPGPAKYDANVKLCKVLNCSHAPFSCSAKRFKEEKMDIDTDPECYLEEEEEDIEVERCPNLTWQFRSRTKRFRNVKTIFNPAMPNLRKPTKETPIHIQELSPFNTSQGRFQPWFDWLPLHVVKGPGPGEYNANKAKCLPAVNKGPMYRARRFKEKPFISPAPNTYNVKGGVEEVLKTHNERLKENVKHQENTKKIWIPPPEPRTYTYEERELMILVTAIKQLEIDDERSLLVIKEESVAGTESKRASTQVDGKRISFDERNRRISAHIDNDRTNATKSEIRTSFDKTDTHITVEKEKKISSSDWQGDKMEKAPSQDKELHAGVQVMNIIPRIETESKCPELKHVVMAPKQKMLRTFLYKHRMPTYF